MALSKKQLKEIKSKLGKTGLDALRQTSSGSQKVIKHKIVINEFEKKKSVVRYAFKPNQLVRVSLGSEKVIGLVISDFEYFSSRVEKNCFFVLVKGSVKQFDGRYIRKI